MLEASSFGPSLQAFEAELKFAGFDLQCRLLWPEVRQRMLGELNCELPSETAELALLVGNSRALWPRFLQAYQPAEPHPLDNYTEVIVNQALQRHSIEATCFFAHQPGANYLPIQRIAHHAGMAWLGPAHLAIHPQVGPWWGLRALLCFPKLDPSEAQALCTPPPIRPPTGSACPGCSAPCSSAWNRLLQGEPLPTEQPVPEGLSPTDRRYLALRDSCPAHREARYGLAQLGYHYSKDPRFLR